VSQENKEGEQDKETEEEEEDGRLMGREENKENKEYYQGEIIELRRQEDGTTRMKESSSNRLID
jgi:hypothetical protein